jgi:arylamine N-acetyltransferase
MSEIDVTGYLARLGIADPGQPSIAALRTLHRAHVERIAYNTVEIHLGRRTTVDPIDSANRVVGLGRAGYCLHLNGAFGCLLKALGYRLLRHLGGVFIDPSRPPPGANGNHLALTVHGLPEPGNPGGSWFVDVGLGDAIYEPLPLVVGEYRQGPFIYHLRHSPVEPMGWRFDHDPAGHFIAVDFVTTPVPQFVLDERHEYLTTSPESVFLNTFLAHRRDAAGAYTLKGCVLTRIGSDAGRWELKSSDKWFSVLTDLFGLRLDDVSETERRQLWNRVSAAHKKWLASRRMAA